MSTRKNGSRFMADFMVDGYRYRRQFPTPEEAAAWETDLKKRLRLGLPYAELLEAKGDSITLGELLDKTLVRYWEGTANERTSITNIRQLEEHFGADKPIARIDTAAIDDLVGAMEKRNLAASTINSRLATLSKAFTFAIDRGYISNRPKIERKRVSNARLRYLTDEEEHTIIDCLESDGRDDFARFFEWSIDTGMRPIESRNVSQTAVRDDDRLGKVVDLRKTKNAYPRTLPLTTRAHKAYTALSDEFLPFARMNENRIRSNWQYVRDCLNETDPEFVFYMTRHTCASRLVQRGVALYAVKEFMGHKTYEMTMRYAKLSPENLLDAKVALEQSPYRQTAQSV